MFVLLRLGVAAVVCCCLQTPSLVNSQDVRMPPRIVKGPIAEVVYRTDHEVKLECVASGNPQPTTSWFKNGILLNPQSNIFYEPDGITIKSLSLLDQGYYQCKASNMYGTALSGTSFLQRAVIGSYASSTVNEVTQLEEGQPYTIHLAPVKCFPKPAFSWAVAKDTIDNAPEPVIQDRRVQIDEDGNLHFSYLVPGDARDGKLYKCNVLNPYLDLTVGGSYTKLTITPKGGVTHFAPVKAFASHSPVVAVEGRNVTLRCFFSGFPDPSLTWSKIGGSLPIGRYTITNYNTELTIRNVQQSDEGDYKCSAANLVNVQDTIIQIDVQSAPTFEVPANQPHAVNVTVGGRVNLTCRAKAEPMAQITWLQNGIALDYSQMPPRMHLAKDGTELILDEVCKDCPDGSTDLQVIQCNASNVHGYNFSDAYINVLQKTMITDKPAPVHLPYDETTAKFHCAATSDDSTHVTLTWYRVADNRRQVNTTGAHYNITISHDGRTLAISMKVNATEDRNKLRGEYRCHASNTYSEDSAVAALTIDDPPTLPPVITDYITTEDPVGVKLLTGGLSDMWWILVIIAGVLLILIIIICCCFCCRRCKGDTYYVDKKEKRDHKDPEKELADSALQPYRRPDADPLKGSRASLGSSMKGDSDEEGSLNEYGDIDAGKFTEDGSFIGDYNTDTRKGTTRPGQSFA